MEGSIQPDRSLALKRYTGKQLPAAAQNVCKDSAQPGQALADRMLG